MPWIRNNFKFLFLFALLAGAGFVWYAVFWESRNGLTVAFLDAGQGDAIFIQAENGNQILIDAGPNKSVLRELGKVMPFYDRSIDMLILTHPDLDHIGGGPEILKRFNVGLIMAPDVSSQSPAYAELEKIRKEKNIREIAATRGVKIIIDENSFMDILFPLREVANLDDNDMSVVAKLVYGKNSYLFTGDSPKKIENYLVYLAPKDLDVDVLKIGHHGSQTSSSEIFVGYTSPQYAVISSGKDNRYGHPHKEVLDILTRLGIKILRTDEMGTIKIKSDGENVAVVD